MGIYLKLKGVRLIVYLDEILVLSISYNQCLIDAQMVVDRFHD